MPPRTDYLKSSRKFDVPLYCASWVSVPKDVHIYKEDEKAAKSIPVSGPLVVFGGGGGASKHGIKNHIIMASYSFADRELSEELYHRSTDEEPPFKLAVHPGGTYLIAVFDAGCKLFEIEVGAEEKLVPSDRKVEAIEKASEQKFVVFNPDGTRVAFGGEDQRLRVFDWPTMDVVLDVQNAHKKPLKDADFSVDGAFLATTADSGPCHVWELSTGTAVATLDMPKGAKIGLCRFSRDASKPFLFTSVVRDGDGWVAVWNTINWQKLGLKKLHTDAISAMAVSPDGNFLATGTNGGDVYFVEVQKMAMKQRVKSAHMVFVTAVQFSPDSSTLLSVSGDSSARVTPVPTSGSDLKIWQIYLFLAALFLLSILVAYIWYLNCDWFYQFPMGREQVGHFSHEALGRKTWPPPAPDGGVGKTEL